MPTAAFEKVFLRAPLARDREEFLALNRASRRLHRGLVMPPTEPEHFEAFLKRCRDERSACFFVCRAGDGRIVGAMNLSEIVRGIFRSAYLGYYVGQPYAGRGYMGEALGLLLRRAFGPLKLHRVEANIQPGNLASVALVRRAGFVKEGYSRRYLKICGRWRDHERWAITVEDWRAARKG
ncbi:MAG: GNAT family N-acetyltransferase [Acidobacteria bacterium]|nr:GNAT family N-acetyltransferase [Acidobacteriota bacterium]MBV9927160.1 GNAT family N-acetyltransferase [Acidobacteriota bacterium]